MQNYGKFTNEKDFLKHTSKPSHITNKIIGKKYAAIHKIKPVLTLNKPIYVRFTVLELRKWLMYERKIMHKRKSAYKIKAS